MIEASGLTKHYGPVTAIDGVTFHVQPGEILGFLGPNGAGKTTTMRILAGCLAASSGTARVAGYDVFEQSLEARRSLGYLPEQVPLYPEMSVEEYLAFAGALHGMPASGLRRRIKEVCARCGLSDVRKRLTGRLSKGYRQRVGLAQALLHNPPVLILDEPTVGLDPRQIIEVRELIRGLAGDHTVLLSTHILAEVSIVCSRVAIIHRGKVVAENTLENLSGGQRSGERLLVVVEGAPGAAEARLRAVPGVMNVTHEPASGAATARFALVTSGPSAAVRREIAKQLVAAGIGLLELTPQRETLEDIFVRLTTAES